MAGPTTFWAPVHRALQRWGNPSALGFPLNAAPSVDFLGMGIQDHRLPYNARGSSAVQPGILGWYGAYPMVANYAPSAIATANIAVLANVVSGTAMTLVAASGAGITKLSTTAPALFLTTGLTLSAGYVIDGLPTLDSFGATGNFNTSFYNRQTTVGRAVSITAAASAVGGHFIVSGYDCYGYAMSENINAAAGAATTNGKKAFKAITSVVPQFTDAHNYSVGTADIFGFGLLTNFFDNVNICWNSARITANTGFVAADATTPATTTTGDVRGTYAVQSASDGTKRLSFQIIPSIASLVTNPTTGLFGQAQA